MKRRISLLLVLALVLSMVPTVFAAETTELISVTDEAVTATGYTFEYTAETAGTLNVTVGTCSPGWRYKIFSPDGSESIYRTKYSAGETCDYTGEAGDWKIVFYAYSSAQADNVDGTVSFTVSFTPNEAGGETTEAPKAEYEVSQTALAVGDNTLTLLDTAVTTIYVFEPTETGVFTFTAPEGAIVGYWGAGSWFLSDPGSTTNTCEWTCTGVGQSAYIGVSGVEGEFTLNVAKTGDYEVVETPIVVYENKATLSAFTIPEGAVLGDYVDVYGDTHTAVYNEADGYYHLDSIDGDVLLVDMNYQDIVLSDALKSDRPVMYAYTTDENGDDVKYDIGTAVQAYEAVMDENGYYPLTEDLILFYDTYAVGAGTYTFYVTGDYNEECVWMYCMRTMNMDNVVVEPSEPETEPTEPETEATEPETEPTEPETEATEPADPNALVSVSNEAVTADGYVFEYTAATAGTLHVSVGECSPGWRYKVFSPDGIESGYRSKYTAGTECDYYNVAGDWKIVLYAYDSSIADNCEGTVSFAVTFTPDEAAGGETEKNAYEVSTSELAVGSNTLTMLDTAVTTVFKFKPTETGTYTITAPAGAVVGNWGTNVSYLTDPGSTTNTCEWTCTGVGQSAYIGVSGVEGDFTLSVELMSGEGETEPTEPETEPTEPETEPTEPEVDPSVPTDVPANTVFAVVGEETTYYENGGDIVTVLAELNAGQTVVLYQDVDLSTSKITVSGNVVLNLNGHKLSSKVSSNAVITVTGTLTIHDTSAEANGVIQNTHASSGYCIKLDSSAANVTLWSGSLIAAIQGIRVSAGTFYGKGGSVTAASYGVYVGTGAAANLSGSKVTATGSYPYPVFSGSDTSTTISDGYFMGQIYGAGLTGNISGGFFSDAPQTAYLAEGCSIVDNADADYPYKVENSNVTEPEPSEPETEPTEPETEPSEPETEPTEPETEPSEPEPEPSEPAESGTLISLTDEAVTATGYTYEYTAATAGTLNVTVGTCSPGWRYKVYFPDGTESIYRTKYSAGETCDYEGIAGNWKIVFYAYSSSMADNVDGTVSFTVSFTPSEDEGGTEVVKAEYEVSETALVLGDNTLTLLDTAVTTIYVFEPTETGVYTFTAPEGAILGYWGAGDWFLSDPGSTTNTYEWTCTGVGQSAYIGVSGVDGEFTLNVAKTGDYEVVETPIVVYENKATLSTFTLPEGAILGDYVDVYGETHTAVYNEADGYYHLDSADGPILLVDMNYMDIVLSDALKSDRPVMYAYTTDADGNTIKYDIGAAVQAYEAVMDENGYYPLTEDLILFYDTYAVGAGTYTFYVTGDYNEECVWMYCMRTVTLPEPVYVAAVYANGQLVASYESLAEAIAACGEGQYVVLTDNLTEDVVISGDVYLDLNGKTLTGNVTGDGKLYCVDTATDDFEGAYGKLTGTVEVTVETFVEMNGKTYLVVSEDGAYSAHCYEVKLTHVSLDATNDALGYKAQFKGDEVVRAHVTGFGFNLWVDDGSVKTYSKDGAFENGQALTLRLKNIMSANGGEMGINANAFVIFDVDGQQKAGTDHRTSMKQAILAVNDSFEGYSDAQKAAVKTLYEQYSDVMDSWFENAENKIAAWEPEV